MNVAEIPVERRNSIRPQPGPQTDFLSTPADIAIFGGGAGGGKTYCLLLEPLRHIHNPKFGGVIFRRTSVQIRNEGGLWDESMSLYPDAGGKPKEYDLTWKFKSGSSISFAHLEYDKNALDWQGSQLAFLGFDELTHFTAKQFWYMLSRNRSASGVRPYVRATCNPDCDSWVADFISWWIDPDTGYAIQERSGVLRWFVRIGDAIHWADTPEELAGFVNPMTGEPIPAKSVTFIPSLLSDNKIFLASDPGYAANLFALPLVERERLLKGNWKIRWQGQLFFDIANLLENNLPVAVPFACDGIFAVADTASKTGKEHDGTAVMFFARSKWFGIPLTIIDWDVLQISGHSLPAWLPQIIQQGEELAKLCHARNGFLGVWIEDRNSGTVLIQSALAKDLPVRPISTKLTSIGKDERAFAVSGYVANGKVKLAETAYHKTVTYKGTTKNHLLAQIENFSIADKDAGKREDDLLDAFCYGISLALGNSTGF